MMKAFRQRKIGRAKYLGKATIYYLFNVMLLQVKGTLYLVVFSVQIWCYFSLVRTV